MAKSDIRTQLYLEREQHEALKREAARREVSMAQVVREAVSTYLVDSPIVSGMSDEEYLADPAWKIAALTEPVTAVGQSNLAEAHDEYLYGPLRSDD